MIKPNSLKISMTLRYLREGLLLTLLSVSASATPQDAKVSDVVLMTNGTKAVSVHAMLQQDDDSTVVSGYVKRRFPSKLLIAGHVDLLVFDNTGGMVLTEQVPIRPYAIPQRVGSRSRFIWRVSPQVTPNSQIEVRFHTGSHSTN